MTATKYIIRPGAGAEPKDKPREVEVCLKVLDDKIALVVGGPTVLVLRPDGCIDRYYVCDKAAEESGVAVDDEGYIKMASEPRDSNAVQAEREACAQVANNHEYLPGEGAATSMVAQDRLLGSIAARIRARGETEGGA